MEDYDSVAARQSQEMASSLIAPAPNKAKKPLSFSSAAPQRPIATHRTTATSKAGLGVARKNPDVGNLDDKAAELVQQVNILKLTVEDLNRERDFYFGKPRIVELFARGTRRKTTPYHRGLWTLSYR
ncbi:Microtubule-associated protein RP/EB family member 1 [Pteropus alecto]|uniref:Microtubule-associated protein RP/EB family member 1 n=1 Tax=Pteropus alecto TaxID=9402 RepID=L5K5Q1_PTEAL|nr:Microtubule-associated protein RP/EB family member 1 [Pteropus alecto]